MMNIFLANGNVLTLDQAFDEITQAHINDATVTVTLLDRQGEPVAGQQWPQTMAFVEGSDGKYRAVLDDELELSDQQRYEAVIDLDAGSGKKANWRVPLFATVRTQ